MKLVVGLGNPGKEYINTRHNIGFMILDQYLDSSDWKEKFDGYYQIKEIFDEKVIFLKPKTFMNLSGNSVLKVVQFYHIAIEDILIIQDDKDIEIGRHRLKKNSSSGGHNGIKSIINSLGTDAFCRLKIGIANKQKVNNTADFVLQRFSKQEMEYWQENYSLYFKIIESFIHYGALKTMNDMNR